MFCYEFILDEDEKFSIHALTRNEVNRIYYRYEVNLNWSLNNGVWTADEKTALQSVNEIKDEKQKTAALEVYNAAIKNFAEFIAGNREQVSLYASLMIKKPASLNAADDKFSESEQKKITDTKSTLLCEHLFALLKTHSSYDYLSLSEHMFYSAAPGNFVRVSIDSLLKKMVLEKTKVSRLKIKNSFRIDFDFFAKHQPPSLYSFVHGGEWDKSIGTPLQLLTAEGSRIEFFEYNGYDSDYQENNEIKTVGSSPVALTLGSCHESGGVGYLVTKLLPIIFTQPECRLVTLSLHCCFDTNADDREINKINLQQCLKVLSKFLPTNKTLTQLDLSDNAIWNEDLPLLMPGLLLNEHVSDINLAKNDFTAESFLQIFQLLEKKRDHLHTLNLGENDIGDDAITLLATALKPHTALTDLDITRWHDVSDSNFSNEGIHVICEALKQPGLQLRTIALSICYDGNYNLECHTDLLAAGALTDNPYVVIMFDVNSVNSKNKYSEKCRELNKRNKKNQVIEESSNAAMSVMACFVMANKSHPFRYSIAPLVPQILRMAFSALPVFTPDEKILPTVASSSSSSSSSAAAAATANVAKEKKKEKVTLSSCCAEMVKKKVFFGLTGETAPTVTALVSSATAASFFSSSSTDKDEKALVAIASASSSSSVAAAGSAKRKGDSIDKDEKMGSGKLVSSNDGDGIEVREPPAKKVHLTALVQRTGSPVHHGPAGTVPKPIASASSSSSSSLAAAAANSDSKKLDRRFTRQ